MLSFFVALNLAQTQPITITVDASKVIHPVSKDLFGIFFEEINCSGDGGIYPELVRNRSFQDADNPEHWSVSGDVTTKVDQGKLKVTATGDGEIINKGYWGMDLEKGQKYTLQITGDFSQPTELSVAAEASAKTVAATNLRFKGSAGETAVAAIIPSDSTTSGDLAIKVKKGQSFTLDYVSLFPSNTFKGRKNGLRPNLMAMLNGIKPSFVRFPGGCWVEGDRMESAYRWKTTINDLKTRRTVPNLWGYKSTNGLGYHEYLQMCEDLGAAPLFVVNCGMAHKDFIPLDKMDEFIQDAVDAIEYANGPVTSKWGAVRAANGHPKPFNLKYLEIGNENGGPVYAPRYKLIFDAVKKKYPNIITIADVWGGTPNSAPVETIDEHYYSSPEFFFDNANRYDSYSRKGPKVYIGEYAVTQGAGSGNHIAAVGEAAFMTGIERNSDHVIMASYAPLFANVNAKAWNPDLIYFDSKNVYGTPSYYVQKMFANNRATDVVKSSASATPEHWRPFPAGGIGVGAWNTESEYKDITLIENGKETKLDDPKNQMKPAGGRWEFEGNVARQTAEEENAQCLFQSPNSQNYTVKLKARKLGGKEGFLVLVGAKDSKNFLWLNLGGWGNTVHAIEASVDGNKGLASKQIPGEIETGRWYDIQVDYSATRIVCSLDGKKIFDEKPVHSPRFFYSTGIDREKRELIVKVVHALPTSQAVAIDVKGVKVGTTATGLMLSSEDPKAENSLGKPGYDVPLPIKANLTGKSLNFVAKPYSVTLLRIPFR